MFLTCRRMDGWVGGWIVRGRDRWRDGPFTQMGNPGKGPD